MTEKSVLILSGGIDSVTLLYDLLNKGVEVFCLIFDYGQKAKKEIDCAIEICDDLDVDYKIINISNLSNIIWNNTLITEGVFDLNPYEADVPSRNTLFIEIASAYAITWSYDNVYLGIIKSNEIFSPDTTPMFIEKINELHSHNNWQKIEVKAPFLNKTKTDVILLAWKLNVPLDKTWTCFYNNEYECGECDSCISKKEAIDNAIISLNER